MNALTLSAARTPLAGSLAACLAGAAVGPTHAAQARGLARRVAVPVLVVASLLAVWSATAPLAGAVVAPGQVQAEFGRKVVQHQEGGLLRELLVRPGQAVRRGEVLMVVGDLRSEATVDLLRRQHDIERLRVARASAELALAAVVSWPDDLRVGPNAEALVREQQLFDARRRALAERIDALQVQQSQVSARVAAMSAQVGAAQRSAELAYAELMVNRELVEGGFIQKTRLMGFERVAAEADARTAAARGQVAESRNQLAALANGITQARAEYRQQAADELKAASTRVNEAADRLRPSVDQADRQAVRAPVDGVVMSLRVSAPGTAIGPREPLLEIAPTGEGLIVETLIDPHDIDHVAAGGAAEVRLAAFNSRSVPLLAATVRSVSPDASSDGANQPARYRAQIEVSASELARRPGLRLQAGMPVEVFITTPSRSLFEYLLEPLGVFTRRALREP